VAAATAYNQVAYAEVAKASRVGEATVEAVGQLNPEVQPHAAKAMVATHNSWVAAKVGAEGRKALVSPGWAAAHYELAAAGDNPRLQKSIWLQLELERLAEETENPGIWASLGNWWNRP
jgi:hypothetical protein